ncbi:MerR family transcriptional regulator [Saccharothrix obliqua]|uniref:MerR family transcriptional regulator n=1 Tax=Saccharothrix obliqua TaxID=2861747 RepID=UPI001C5DCACD|nr:MerR family transcriptional regulator [Saccharothrix obliqua]MBW4721674.1 MerR family transcriptional regulator [Saccharothrix obliqua]
MLIGELSERTGATVRMLRYYDQQGLLRPQRTDSRYRVYDEADVERVRSVRCLISSGLNVRLARLVLAHAFDEEIELPEDEAGCVPLLEMLQEELAAVNTRIGQLERSKGHLERLVADVGAIMADKRAVAACGGAESIGGAELVGSGEPGGAEPQERAG